VQPLGAQQSGKLAGLSARYFSSPGGSPRSIELSGDAKRVEAWFVPLLDGVPALSQATQLPFAGDADGIVVVSGRASDHRDVAFELSSAFVEPPVDEPSSAGAGGALPEAGAASGGATGEATGGAAADPFGGAAAEPLGGAGSSSPGAAGAAVSQAGADQELTPDDDSPASAVASRDEGGCTFSSALPHSNEIARLAASLAVAAVLLARRRNP
jgi:hypothetical protein